MSGTDQCNENASTANPIDEPDMSRPAVAHPLPEPCRNRCVQLLDELMLQDAAKPFNAPVDAAEIPSYHRVVKTPMDLGTIKVCPFDNILISPQWTITISAHHDTRIVVVEIPFV